MRHAVIIAFILFGQYSISQLKDPLMGVEYSTDRKENFSGFIGENAIGLYTADYIYHNKRKQELIIRNFHKGDLQLVNSKNIYSQILEGYSNDPEEIFYQNGKFYLFSTLHSDKDKTRLLGLEVFNELCDRESWVILDTLRSEEVQYVVESETKDGFLVASHLKYTQLVEQEIDLIMVGPEGDVKWSKYITSPMALQSLRIEKIKFSSKSPIYILCNYAFDLGTNPSIDQSVNNQYAIWAYDHDKKFLKEFDIRLKKKWINGIEMSLQDHGGLLVSGYFNESKNPAINGVFSLLVNNDLSLKNTSWYRFESGIYDKFIKKQDNKNIVELPDYQLKKMVILEDNSFFLLGEQYYKYIERSYDPRTNITTTTEHYNYNSVIANYFDNQGNHQWSERIPKSQSSTNDLGYFSSFATLEGSDDVFLFFNDSRKNNENPPAGYFDYVNLFNNRKFQISYVQLTPEGVAKRAGLIDSGNNYMLRAKLCGQLSEDAAYLITETVRGSKIIRVERD